MAGGPDIGRLRHRIVVEEPVDVPDGAGGFARTWRDAGTVWADIEARSASFGLTADAAGQTIVHRIVMRWHDDLSARHRLRAGTATYIIRSVYDPTGERRFLVALTEEKRP
ncbi:phage head closure protein [Terrihabitans sp. B22-R8]|uniref:phage head closure protein n=1 Tax=Terrihabitans sp. B22-R8 TaxID=3425128 RepID=UPI00403C8C42